MIDDDEAAPVPNRVVDVNPSEASIAALSRWPDDGPIAMLNLLRFAGNAGRADYASYAAAATSTIFSRGGSLLHHGAITESTGIGEWDQVAIVRYPRRASFLDMQRDPAYVAAIPLRTSGLAARMLYPFALPDDEDVPAITGQVVVELFADAPGPSDLARVQLDLPSGGPGLVTDRPFARLRVSLAGSEPAPDARLVSVPLNG